MSRILPSLYYTRNSMWNVWLAAHYCLLTNVPIYQLRFSPNCRVRSARLW